MQTVTENTQSIDEIFSMPQSEMEYMVELLCNLKNVSVFEKELIEPQQEYQYESENDDSYDDQTYSFSDVSCLSPILYSKAPPRTACEKHRRWKKRCPEICPQRKKPSLSKKNKKSKSLSEDDKADKTKLKKLWQRKWNHQYDVHSE